MTEQRTCCNRNLEFFLKSYTTPEGIIREYEAAQCKKCNELYVSRPNSSMLFRFKKRERDRQGHVFTCGNCQKGLASWRREGNKATLYCSSCEK